MALLEEKQQSMKPTKYVLVDNILVKVMEDQDMQLEVEVAPAVEDCQEVSTTLTSISSNSEEAAHAQTDDYVNISTSVDIVAADAEEEEEVQ